MFGLLERKNSQRYKCVPVCGLWLMVWLDGQEFERNMIRKLVTRRFEEEVCGQTSLNGQNNLRILVSLVNVHQRATQQRRVLTCPVGTSLFPQPVLTLPNGLKNKWPWWQGQQ